MLTPRFSSPNGTMTACVGQFTQRNTTGQLCWLEDRMADHRNVMTKLKNDLGGRQEIEDADIYSGRRHMKSRSGFRSTQIIFQLKYKINICYENKRVKKWAHVLQEYRGLVFIYSSLKADSPWGLQRSKTEDTRSGHLAPTPPSLTFKDLSKNWESSANKNDPL